ncbi:DUF389 domain-containing protein [bacterium]|nr:DUF389 domain-containing protein [bacterium]NCQ54793.1 DUF389 domain-containing protein [Candidatus Parcubacteria bacterium]NCS66837.1 DUF389 domain-containing protein [Candidatus Peregrinibacteria bacterium]NCS95783.1 DUF389 domain-containing protein [bacterium]
MFEKITKNIKNVGEDAQKERFKWWSFVPFKRDKKAREAVDKLMESSRLEPSFFVMSGLSAILATLGILLNDIPILIAAMVLAPLLNPVLACAAGFAINNKTLVWYALKSFVGSVVFVILVSAMLVFVLDNMGYDFDITTYVDKFKRFDHLLFLAAFVSGFAGVYSWLKATNASNLVGVAIAVSLIPFVSFFGVLLGLQEFSLINYYWQPFMINLVTILVGATSAFLLLGFSRQKRALDQEVEQNKED